MSHRFSPFNRTCSILLAGVTLVAGVGSADNQYLFAQSSIKKTDLPAPASAATLLENCHRRLPLEPISMTGWISMRKPRGIVSKKLGFRVELHWGGIPPLARYTILDSKNEVLEQVIVRRGAEVELARLAGPNLEPAQTPEWNASIQDSDVTWLDVTLQFLWWKNPVLAGEETVKGRLCDILDVFPPDPLPDCAKVRLWLDRETSLLLKAEELNAKGDLNRRLWVRSARKMGDRWMVSDLEVESRGSGHRTRLHITDLVTTP